MKSKFFITHITKEKVQKTKPVCKEMQTGFREMSKTTKLSKESTADVDVLHQHFFSGF